MPRLIGVTEALRLITEGRQLSPAEALKKGLVHEVAPAAEIVERARQWILKGGEGVQPWDKKGFKVPGGAGQTSAAAAQAFMVGTALTAKTTMRNYPAPAAILSCVYEGTQVPIDAGPAHRVEVLRQAAGRAGGAQPDAHDVREQGARRQAGAPSGGPAQVAGAPARRPRRRHDGRGRRLRVGTGRHGRGAARQHDRARREGQGLFAAAAREGREPRQAQPGRCGRDPRAHQAHREL